MPGIFDPGIFDSGIFDTPSAGGTGSFTANAVLKATRTGSFTANAVIRRNQTGSFTADAVLRRTQSNAFTADAVLRRTQSATFTADAFIFVAGTAAFSADAVLSRTQSASFTADAVRSTTLSGSFTVDAALKRTVSGSFTASAVITRSQTGSFTANATIKWTQAGSFTVDAFIVAGFTANAVKRRTQTSSFTANAIRRKNQTGSFTASALIRKTFTGSFTADASWAYHFTGSFTANATIRAANSNSFTVDYATWSGVGPPPPLIGVPTKIFVNGVEITSHVKWPTATFSSKVNSQTGECSFDVIDRAHNLTFETGDEVQLYIDGVLRWAGWILQAKRTFPFPVMKSPTTEARIWHIGGVDYNRFLDRRILHDSGQPDRTWDYAAGTYDNTILNDLWNYFDTAGFTKDFHRVDVGVLDIKGVTAKTGGNVAQGGFSLRDVLLHLTWDTGAIFFVTPKKVVTYVDADLISNPYTLTDQPSGPLDVGFHDVRILEDSTEMVNDAIVWGAGKGSDQVVESRYESVPSQTVHGVWQAGNFTAGIYKQATADAVSRAQVEGSPASKRGAKNPRRAVELLTWSPVFGVGDVVHFHDSQFFLPPADPSDPPSHDDVLPIRTMTVTWPTPFQPLFSLQLSWEVDAIWSFFDPWLPVGPAGLGGGGGVFPPGGTDPPPGVCECGITDTFTRVVTPGWGISDSSIPWVTPTGAVGTSFSVDGSAGIFDATTASNANLNRQDLYPFATTYPIEVTLHATAVNTPYNGTSDFSIFSFQFDFNVGTSFNTASSYTIGFGTNSNFTAGSGSHNLAMYVALHNYSMTIGGGNIVNINDSRCLANFTGQPFTVKVLLEADRISAKYWFDTDAEPSSYQVTQAQAGTPTTTVLQNLAVYYTGDAGLASGSFTIDSLDISGVNDCTAVQFDDFNRTVAITPSGGTQPSTLGMGIATPSGYQWLTQGWNSQNHISVNGSRLVFNWVATTSLSGLGYVTGPGPWTEPSWTMTSRFTAARPSAVADVVFKYRVGSFAVLTLTMGVDDAVMTSGVGVNVPFAWTNGATYNIKWEVTWDGPERIKVWPVGTAEPSVWLSETSSNGSGVPGSTQTFQVDLFGSLGSNSTSQLSLDYIDFDYAGRPCFPLCGPDGGTYAVFDDFNRTTSDPGWGFASIFGGYLWTIGTFGTPPKIAPRYSAYVNGTQGHLFADSSGLGAFGEAVVTGRQTSTSPFSAFQVQVPFVIEFDQTNSVVYTGPGTPGTGFAGTALSLSSGLIGSDTTSVGLFMSVHGSVHPSWVAAPVSSLSTLPNSSIYYDNGWYDEGPAMTTGTIRVVGDEVGVTVTNGSTVLYQPWRGNYPPGDIITVPTGTIFKQLLITADAQGDFATSTIDMNEIRAKDLFGVYGSTWCSPGPQPPPGGFGVPAGTHMIAEVLVPLDAPSGGLYPLNSHWQATNSILSGTAILSVNGSVQYGNYSVFDADNGIIEIDPHVLDTSVVTLDYITNGSLP